MNRATAETSLRHRRPSSLPEPRVRGTVAFSPLRRPSLLPEAELPGVRPRTGPFGDGV